MAGALAMLHWSADVDAKDVEFVLTGPRNAANSRAKAENGSAQSEAKTCCRKQGAGVGSWYSDVLGEHAMWLLDLDCCR